MLRSTLSKVWACGFLGEHSRTAVRHWLQRARPATLPLALVHVQACCVEAAFTLNTTLPDCLAAWWTSLLSCAGCCHGLDETL
jgi:hypothetical protein